MQSANSSPQQGPPRPYLMCKSLIMKMLCSGFLGHRNHKAAIGLPHAPWPWSRFSEPRNLCPANRSLDSDALRPSRQKESVKVKIDATLLYKARKGHAVLT